MIRFYKNMTSFLQWQYISGRYTYEGIMRQSPSLQSSWCILDLINPFSAIMRRKQLIDPPVCLCKNQLIVFSSESLQKALLVVSCCQNIISFLQCQFEYVYRKLPSSHLKCCILDLIHQYSANKRRSKRLVFFFDNEFTQPSA